MTFYLFGSRDHVVVSVAINFSFCLKWYARFHYTLLILVLIRMAYAIRIEMFPPWEDIFNLDTPDAAIESCERVEIDAYSPIRKYRSSILYFDDSGQLVSLPLLREITSIVCNTRKDLLCT